MSDDELEKLASAMKNVRPSDAARDAGMSAAMAAFDAEFAAETLAAKETAEEKNMTPDQGLANAPRPTEQTTRDWRVRSFGRDFMTRIDKIFTPKMAMMGGTCMAAFIASFVVYQAVPGDRFIVPETQPAAVEMAATSDDAQTSSTAEVDEITVTAKREEAEETSQSAELGALRADEVMAAPAPIIAPSAPVVAPSPPQIERAAPTASAEPKGQDGINSISDLLNKVRTDAAKPEVESRDREAKFRQRRDKQAGLLSQAHSELRALEKAQGLPLSPAPSLSDDPDKSVREYRAILQRKDNIARYAAPHDKFAAAKNGNPRLAQAPVQTQFVNGYILEEVPGEFEAVTEDVVVQEASTELVTIPATYETVMETVVVTPQSVEYVVEAPTYEWVEGDVEGNTVEYVSLPAEYETVQEPVVVQEASTELVTIPATYQTVQETVVVRPQQRAADGSTIPAVTKQISRRVVKTPASTQERVVPAITKMETRRVIKTPASTVERIVPYEKRDGKTRVPVKPAKVSERAVPAVTKQVSRRVVKTPARTQERVKPSVPQQVTRVVAGPSKFYLRDENGKIIREFESRDAFEVYKLNTITSVKEKPVSTFSVDVDTASYSFMRSAINRGQLPPRSSIRLEEMINYFPYDYAAPRSADQPFKANVTVTPTPWNADTKLMHIGIKGYTPPRDERPSSNIVFLIDTSGSMNAPNKLPLLVSSFKLLLSTLDADDTVSIVTYAGRAGTVLEPTPASDKAAIKEALDRLRSGGSTAGAAGLELAYQKAQESFDEDSINRVILATDGDFNVGFSSPDEMKSFVEKKRETGIFLSVLGFGNGNYNDHLMQSLAQNGNGIAAYIDTLAEANKVLADEAGSALVPIAKDVKIQVEFNPDVISEYRLLGYETRALKRQDFNNDKVDAGEINAGHTVTAIYEMTPVGSPAQMVDDLRYASDAVETTGSDEYAFVKIRHKLPTSNTSTLQTFPVGDGNDRSLRRASDDMRFATAVVAFGQKLRGDTQLTDFSYDETIALASEAKGEDENGYRAEFIQLVRLAENLQD